MKLVLEELVGESGGGGTVGVRLAPLSKNIVQKESAVFRILSLKQLF